MSLNVNKFHFLLLGAKISKVKYLYQILAGGRNYTFMLDEISMIQFTNQMMPTKFDSCKYFYKNKR